MTKAELSARKAELEIQRLELQNWQLEKENALIRSNPVAEGFFNLTGPVVEDAVAELMHRMTVWSNNHPKEPITLVMNTQGGTVVDGFALYDFLQLLKKKGHHLTTVGLGLVASMGAVLVQAGNDRVMSPHCWMMIHEVHGVISGTTSEKKSAMKFNERSQNQALNILADRASWSARSIKNRWKDDLWLDSNDALKAGLIDRIEDTIALTSES